MRRTSKHCSLKVLRIWSFIFVVVGCVQQRDATEGSPAAQTPQQPAAQAGPGPVREITNITGDLYRARENNHNTVFLVTSEGVILADPINTGFAEWLKSELADRFGTTVEYALYSHHHWDHASGGSVFDATATFVGHENMAQALSAPLPGNFMAADANHNGRLKPDETAGGLRANFDRMDSNRDGGVTGAEINVDIRPPDVACSNHMTVSLGGKTVELIHPVPAHSDDMTVVFFPEERTVFGVDYINVNRLPGEIAGYSFEAWDSALAVLEALDFDILAPGHADMGTKADLAAYRGYFETLRAAVAAGIVEGRSVEELQRSIRLDSYSGWLRYDSRRESNIAEAYGILMAGP